MQRWMTVRSMTPVVLTMLAFVAGQQEIDVRKTTFFVEDLSFSLSFFFFKEEDSRCTDDGTQKRIGTNIRNSS